MVRKADNGSGRKRVGSRFLQITGGVSDFEGMRDYTQLPAVDGSDESDAAKEQRRIRAAGKRKAHDDLDPKDNPSQLTYDRPSSMPSHISLGAPVTHKTAKDLTPTFLVDAKVEVKRPNFIRWFIATFLYQCSACATKKVPCGYPPVADGIQRKFTCTTCLEDRGVSCSWLQDLLEVYIREAYQLDVGEARILASSKENDPQGTLSSYYRTWLAEPAGHCSDDELGGRLRALGTIISSERPESSSRASSAESDSLQPASYQHSSTQLPSPEIKPRPHKRLKLIAPLPQAQHPPAQSSSSSSLPPSQGPSTPAAVRISPGGSRLSPTTPGRASPLPSAPAQSPSTAAFDHIFPGRPTPPSPLLPFISGPDQHSAHPANYILAPAKFSPPTIPPTNITKIETCISTPQNHSPAQMDDLHIITQYQPGDNLLDTSQNNVNAGVDQASTGADPRSPSCDIVGLKSDMANLLDGLAKLAMEDPSFRPEFSNRQEAEFYLLKTLQGSLQTCDFLGSVVNEQDSRHITVIGSLEDRIRLLTLENVELKQGVAVKCLEQKICLLEVENDQLRGRLVRQDQELEQGRLQGRVVKGLEQKIRQLEVKKEQLQGKLAQQEQAIATMNIRTQLADNVLWGPTSQHDLPAPDDAQIPNPVADTNLRNLISMIHAHLDVIQPTLATK